ncbi:MAG: hypothetical protein JSU86_04460 [Phycisphaerales bacterium]|nr:MAG: hypothetical protein JSU86_04460 [Phycisphaerales bacterium]
MAGRYLQGNDWANDWTTLPDAGDNGYIPSGLGEDVNLNLDRTGEEPDLIRIDEGYDHNIGSSGAPLKIACDKLEVFGSGNLYYACTLDGSTARVTADVLIQCGMPGNIVELDSVASDLGLYKRVVLTKGTLRLLGNMQWHNTDGTLRVSGLENPGDANVHIAACDTIPAFDFDSGICRAYADITVARVGGQLTQEHGGRIGTLDIYQNGYVTYNHTGMTTCRIHSGGALDLSHVRKELTIATVIAMPRSRIIGYDSAKHTFTAFYDYRRAYE